MHLLFKFFLTENEIEETGRVLFGMNVSNSNEVYKTTLRDGPEVGEIFNTFSN